MMVEAFYHNPMSSYAYAVSSEEIRIRFRTKKQDVDHVILHYGRKFAWNEQYEIEMKKLFTDTYYDYYQTNLKVADNRIGYYFEVHHNQERCYVTEAGIYKEFQENIAHCLYYQYPSIHPADLLTKPTWYENAVFYQIFVDRFANGDSSINPEFIADWDSKPESKSVYGGDFEGVRKNLWYLEELGINAIYFTPIFEAPSNHKYNTTDYKKLDPYFGSMESFKNLVKEAHTRGIRIVLDAVFNHCSDLFWAFEDVERNQEHSAYKDWFLIHEFPLTKNPPNYDTFANIGYMPRFNTANEEVQHYLLDVITYWTTECGIDGWRLDVADELSHVFLRKLRDTVKSLGTDLIIIGENWHDGNPWLQGDQFDSIMNYAVTFQTTRYFAKQEINAKQFSEELTTLLMRYGDTINELMFNLLDSHDTERFLFLCKEDKRKLKNAVAFLYSYVGIPCIFYGTEIGLTGGYDPYCRVAFPWEKEKWDEELLTYFKRIIGIRKNYKAFIKGTVSFLSTEELFIMKRTYEGESIYIVINGTERSQTIPSEIAKNFGKEILTGESDGTKILAMSTSYFEGLKI